MDGYEVARRLRQEEGFHDAMIIAVTGYGQEDGYNYSRAEGFDHHLIKPVQIEALVAALADPGREPCRFRSLIDGPNEQSTFQRSSPAGHVARGGLEFASSSVCCSSGNLNDFSTASAVMATRPRDRQ